LLLWKKEKKTEIRHPYSKIGAYTGSSEGTSMPCSIFLSFKTFAGGERVTQVSANCWSVIQTVPSISL
jgi:hypothetical protein